MSWPALRDIDLAPELLEVALAEAALRALADALTLVHGNAVAAERPLPAACGRRARWIMLAAGDLRRELRAYRAQSLKLLRRPPDTDDRPF